MKQRFVFVAIAGFAWFSISSFGGVESFTCDFNLFVGHPGPDARYFKGHYDSVKSVFTGAISIREKGALVAIKKIEAKCPVKDYAPFICEDEYRGVDIVVYEPDQVAAYHIDEKGKMGPKRIIKGHSIAFRVGGEKQFCAFDKQP